MWRATGGQPSLLPFHVKILWNSSQHPISSVAMLGLVSSRFSLRAQVMSAVQVRGAYQTFPKTGARNCLMWPPTLQKQVKPTGLLPFFFFLNSNLYAPNWPQTSFSSTHLRPFPFTFPVNMVCIDEKQHVQKGCIDVWCAGLSHGASEPNAQYFCQALHSLPFAGISKFVVHKNCAESLQSGESQPRRPASM